MRMRCMLCMCCAVALHASSAHSLVACFMLLQPHGEEWPDQVCSCKHAAGGDETVALWKSGALPELLEAAGVTWEPEPDAPSPEPESKAP